MRSLEEFGVYSSGAEALQHDDANTTTPEQFFDQSQSLLGRLALVTMEDIVPNLRDHYGRWHPSGFMVYPLGTHKELGTLRLHMWPKGHRQREMKGHGELPDDICDGDIHNHAWHISSVVLDGVYTDSMYDVKKVGALNDGVYDEAEVARRSLWNVFQVQYRQGDQPEGLYASGDVVDAAVRDMRQFGREDFHIIPAGPFHAPTIPEEVKSATLVFNSKRVFKGGPDILISGSASPVIGNRLDVTEDEAKLVEEQFS